MLTINVEDRHRNLDRGGAEFVDWADCRRDRAESEHEPRKRDRTMTIARTHLVDPAVTRWYHCITRCVRRAFLLGEGQNDRKLWIDNRLKELAGIFSIAVGGFSVMDNHLHVLSRKRGQEPFAGTAPRVLRTKRS
jgi:hypothetical protein